MGTPMDASVPQKTCKVCGETKDAVCGTWPMLHDEPYKNECCTCVAAKYRLKRLDPVNGDKIRANTRKGNAKLRATPEGRQKHTDASLLWQQANPGRMAAKSKAYKLGRTRRTPAWLTAEDYKAMENKYIVAQWFSQISGLSYHVDHIIPLNGANVSGLHVPDNLCVKLGTDNLSKGNRWVP